MKSDGDFHRTGLPVGLVPDAEVVGDESDEISVLVECGLAPVPAADVVFSLELEDLFPKFLDGRGGDAVVLRPVALVSVGISVDRELNGEHDCLSEGGRVILFQPSGGTESRSHSFLV